jgi:predicted amidohydrolase
MSRVLKLAVVQSTPRLRAPDDNIAHIAHTVASLDAELILTPELSVTGYDVGDDAARLAMPLVMDEPLPSMGESLPDALTRSAARLVLGMIERGAGGTPYNAAVIVQRGIVRFIHRKIYLPTYGMFDEARFFGRGRNIDVYEHAGWRVGVLVCEDFWHPGLVYVLATAGIELLLVLAAAPGRGVWEGGAEEGLFASADVWQRIARVTAQQYGIYVALANRAGVEGAVTFAGGSLVVGPDGTVLARAGELDAQVLEVQLSHDEIERARRPFAHARDDDPRVVCDALRRLGCL